MYQEADFATMPGTHVGGTSPKGLLYWFPPPRTKVTNKNAFKLEYSSFLPKPIINPLNKQTN